MELPKIGGEKKKKLWQWNCQNYRGEERKILIGIVVMELPKIGEKNK